MKKLYVEDFIDVASAMYDEIVKEKREEVMFVGFYEEAIEVIKELMMYEEVIPHSIEIHPEDWDWYDKEYYVTLDEDFELWVEPAFSKNHDRYLMGYADVLFMTGDCNSAILNEVECELAVEIVFDEEDNEKCDGCCKECCCHSGCSGDSEFNEISDNSVTTRVAVDKDGHIHGFERTWETNENGMHYYSHYEYFSNNEELLREMIDNLDIKLK